MTVFNLPAHGNLKLPLPGEPGRWQGVDLESLAIDLKAGNAPAKREDIRALPDAWAQAILAGQALADPEKHDLRDVLIPQWRALIATVALAGEFRDVYELSVTPAAGEVVATAGIAAVLRGLLLDKLAPVATVQDGTSWRNCVAVVSLARKVNRRVQEPRPIALTVPDILIAPGRPFGEINVPGAPWLAGGPRDPLACDLPADQLKLLQTFCEALIVKLKALPATGRNAVTNKVLSDALHEMATECDSFVYGALTIDSGEATGKLWPGPSHILDTPLRIVGNAVEGKSDCKLKLRGLDAPPFKSIILADPALARTLGRAPDKIRLYDTFMLSAVADGRLDEAKLRAAANGHLILSVDDVLTAQLARLDDGSTLPAHAASAQSFLLPLTPALLLVADGVTLAANAIVRDDGRKVTAGVAIELASGDRQMHELLRSYEGGAIRRVERLDNFGLWPNFASPAWKWYGVRAQSNPMTELCLAVAASGPLVAADIGVMVKGRTKIGRLGDWIGVRVIDPLAGEQLLGDGMATFRHFPFTPVASADNRGVQSWSSLPVEAMFMTVDGRPVGCIIPQVDKARAADATKAATVAIDFGTSNTIARFRLDSDQTEFVRFQSRVVHPIAPEPGQAAFAGTARSAFADFLPISGQPMPFPTLMKTRVLPEAVDEDVPGAEENIFFSDPEASASGISELLGWIEFGDIKANIKWDPTEVGKRRSKRFLSLLVMMIGAELAVEGVLPGKIRWRLSYPNAFDADQVRAFERAIRYAIEHLIPPGSGEQSEPQIAFYSEGAAAKQTLVRSGSLQSDEGLIIMLDIGGGTTDIAIWHGSTTLWHGSFRLAAREFFTDGLARHPSILAAAGVIDSVSSEKLQAWSQEGSESPRARNIVELAIGRPEFDAAFRKSLLTRLDNPEWLALERTASAALGGMLWYLGRLIRARRLDGQWKLSEAELQRPTIALVGRGSSYFSHLDPTMDGRLPKIVSLLTQAIGIDGGHPAIHFSKSPKQEVVEGLLQLDGVENPFANVDSAMIIGERITIRDTDESKAFSESDYLALVPKTDVGPDIELAEMKSFLAAFKVATRHDFDLTQSFGGTRLETMLKTAIRTRLIDKARPIEMPLFILALKRLVSELARQ